MIDGDLPAVATDTTPRARKRHDCCECVVPIEPGQRYEHVRGLWEGEWRTCKTCLRCVELRTLYAEAEGGRYEYGGLQETLLNGPLAPTGAERQGRET